MFDVLTRAVLVLSHAAGRAMAARGTAPSSTSPRSRLARLRHLLGREGVGHGLHRGPVGRARGHRRDGHRALPGLHPDGVPAAGRHRHARPAASSGSTPQRLVRDCLDDIERGRVVSVRHRSTRRSPRAAGHPSSPVPAVGGAPRPKVSGPPCPRRHSAYIGAVTAATLPPTPPAPACSRSSRRRRSSTAASPSLGQGGRLLRRPATHLARRRGSSPRRGRHARADQRSHLRRRRRPDARGRPRRHLDAARRRGRRRAARRLRRPQGRQGPRPPAAHRGPVDLGAARARRRGHDDDGCLAARRGRGRARGRREVVAVATIADRATGAGERISAEAGVDYRFAYSLEELGLA